MKTLKDLKIGDTVFTVEYDVIINHKVTQISSSFDDYLLRYINPISDNKYYSQDKGKDYNNQVDSTFIAGYYHSKVYFNQSEAIQAIKNYLQNLLTKQTAEMKEISTKIEDTNNRIKKYL